MKCLFKLFLGAKLRRMSTLLLPAVGSLGWKTCVALTADGLLTIEFPGKHGKGWVVDTSAKPQN